MSKFNLTKAELAWLDKLEKLMESAPKGIGDKVAAYTIGDPIVCFFHEDTYEEHIKGYTDLYMPDVCVGVDSSGSEIKKITFPISIWSTSG